MQRMLLSSKAASFQQVMLWNLTIAHLQSKIESLEDENAAYKESVESLTASVLELTQENDARMSKIAALESQF
jgi:predicted  nucleic acid-binding Zn-ribbon protein